MKKFWTLLLALALTIALCACGGKTEAEPTPEPETAETETATPTPTPTPANAELGSGRFDTFEAAFTGAELFTDANGDDALRVYFDFTNLSEDAVSAQERLLISAVQDGKPLLWAETEAPTAEADNLALRVQSGHPIHCVLEYALVSDRPVALLMDDDDGHTVSALLPLDQLPGAPEPEEASAEPETTEETLTTQLDASCLLSGLYEITITGGEVADTDAGRVMTVSLDFTNQSDPQEVDIWSSFRLFAYQDGVELPYAEEEEGTLDLAAFGETVTTSATFVLRSESPVLVELYGFREEAPCAGLVIPAA